MLMINEGAFSSTLGGTIVSALRMISTLLSLAVGVFGCTAHLPLRTELGAHHPTQILSFRATSEEHEIAEITAPVEDDDQRDIKIVATHPIEPIRPAIELQVRDPAGATIHGTVEVTCGQDVVYPGGNSGRPGCELVRDLEIDKTSPMQPIRLFVRSIAGRDVPIVVTLTYGLGEKIRVREGPRLAPQ
jgi:hypothetical protein